jgi:hypothetical protein
MKDPREELLPFRLDLFAAPRRANGHRYDLRYESESSHETLARAEAWIVTVVAGRRTDSDLSTEATTTRFGRCTGRVATPPEETNCG